MNRWDIRIDLVKAAFIALIIKVMSTFSLIIPWTPLADTLCVAFSICVMLIKLCRLTLHIGKLIALCAVSLFALYTCVSIQQYDLLVTMIAIFLLIDEDMEEYIALMLKIQTVFLIGHIIAAAILSTTGSQFRFWYTADERLRFNGGMLHPNVLSCFIVSCMLMFSWLHFQRITANQFCWLIIIACFTFLASRSRTGLLLTLFLLLLIFLTQMYSQLVEKLITPLIAVLFPVISAFLFLMQKLYISGNRAALLLNDLLTTRIKLGAYAYVRSGISWLPRYLDYTYTGMITWTQEWNLSKFTFDCLYSYMPIQMGILWVCIFSLVFVVASKKLDFRDRIFMLFWMLFAITEVHGLNCFKFFPLLLLSSLFSKKGAEDHPFRKD